MARDREELKDTLDALDRLMRMFAAERYVYLILAVLSFATLLIFAYQLVTTKNASIEVLTAVFGGSGLVAASAARITWFFNRAFTLIERLVQGASDEK
jgi:hypothetical protein